MPKRIPKQPLEQPSQGRHCLLIGKQSGNTDPESGSLDIKPESVTCLSLDQFFRIFMYVSV